MQGLAYVLSLSILHEGRIFSPLNQPHFIIIFILAVMATGFAAIAKYISFLFLLSLSW